MVLYILFKKIFSKSNDDYYDPPLIVDLNLNQKKIR